MEQPLKITIVDDDTAARLTAAAALDAPEYTLSECMDGPALLAAVECDLPDLILLDIEMPGLDGIETCRRLRAAGHDTVPVMFVSAHNDLETRLLAYEAGGSDYIVKPFEAEELARKTRAIRQQVADRHELAAQASYAQQTAMTVMSSLAEMGVVLDFMRNSFACTTPDALAAKLLEALRQFNLDGMLELRSTMGRSCHNARGGCTPLETAILEHAAKMERIFQFRNRLTINYPTVTLFVHPLPLDDPDRVGRLRDHLAILAEGAEARLAAMDLLCRQTVQASGIGEAIAELSATLEKIDRQQAAHRLRASDIDEDYLRDLVNAFVHLGLSEDQETRLAEMAQQTHARLAALRDESHDVSDRLRDVARKLERLVRC